MRRRYSLTPRTQPDLKRSFLLLAVVLALATGWVQPVEANHAAQTVPYVVQPNDTLASIAARHCTTWQQLYALNRRVIGPNPNVLRSGTVIWVPAQQCGGPPPGPSLTPGPCPSGPIPHAMGPVSGTTYTVVPGDTLFSIAHRFCTTPQQLAATNGLRHPWLIFAGQQLTVPAVGPPGPTLTPTPTPTRPPTTPTPPTQRYVTITFPTPGSVLPQTFTVNGAGAGLFEGNVVVTAFANTGQQLAQVATTLQGPNVGAGAPGTFTVALTVNVAAGTPGTVQATSPQSNVAPSIVNVVFGTAPQPSYRVFAPGECRIQSKPNAPLFAYPNGPQTGQFGPASGTFDATAGARINNQFWYQISTTAGSPPVWAPVSSINTTIGSCTW